MDRSERKLETGIDILEIDVNEIMIGWVFEWVYGNFLAYFGIKKSPEYEY